MQCVILNTKRPESKCHSGTVRAGVRNLVEVAYPASAMGCQRHVEVTVYSAVVNTVLYCPVQFYCTASSSVQYCIKLCIIPVVPVFRSDT
jgi:hypothetical protein